MSNKYIWNRSGSVTIVICRWSVVVLTNILYWRTAVSRKASAAMEVLKMSFCSGCRMPNFAKNEYRTRSSEKSIKSASSGWMVCIWSGLISQLIPSNLPSINVACNVHRELCVSNSENTTTISIVSDAHHIRVRKSAAHLLFVERPKYWISHEWV